ncbi:D-alanine--D-alanine ligase family protein [Culicoidibacter larvae]|uniref:D-alanine--D-alanine ligase n=1 Tax=Culicoidibacter larvae TaxID=2579976 RepID=A0A5R8QDR5_9FIRM|nr:D-alanine--D-alanine ligase family protein [Culicoidibacter larvae]TLG75415.1 D-alanine--D-alanine ligase [Culicoidibacter larvae]
MSKTNVAIFFGGKSSEYAVSLQSAYAVISTLNTDIFKRTLIGISKFGQWFHYTGALENIKHDTWLHDRDNLHPITAHLSSSHPQLYANTAGIETALPIDVALPILHGKNGEDGTLQGMLELLRIPIAGCTTMSSALCMDKYRAHQLIQEAGIKVPRGMLFNSSQNMGEIGEQVSKLTYPLYVKPVCGGSSIGISKVNSAKQLNEAITEAFQHDENIIIEEHIDGIEVGCGIIGKTQLTIGAVDEVEIDSAFNDYNAKYEIPSKIHVPARIDPELRQKIQEASLLIYRTLGCSGFARVDCFLTPQNEIYFNEVNTIPGMTEKSRFPKMMAGIGLSLQTLTTTIIENTLTNK